MGLTELVVEHEVPQSLEKISPWIAFQLTDLLVWVHGRLGMQTTWFWLGKKNAVFAHFSMFSFLLRNHVTGPTMFGALKPALNIQCAFLQNKMHCEIGFCTIISE
jgi:hypothetical protein